MSDRSCIICGTLPNIKDYNTYVYEDGIGIKGNDEEKIMKLKRILVSEFKTKDLENLKYFLGIEVTWSKKGITVSKRKYVIDLLNKTEMSGCKLVGTSNIKFGIQGEVL